MVTNLDLELWKVGWNALLHASIEGHYLVVKYLVEECKVAVNVKDQNGWTSLMNAASNGYVQIVKVLVEVGKASVNDKSNVCISPLPPMKHS